MTPDSLRQRGLQLLRDARHLLAQLWARGGRGGSGGRGAGRGEGRVRVFGGGESIAVPGTCWQVRVSCDANECDAGV